MSIFHKKSKTKKVIETLRKSGGDIALTLITAGAAITAVAVVIVMATT